MLLYNYKKGDNMKKVIIYEETNNELVSNKFLNFIISLVCYAIVLVFVSLMFKSFYISNEYYGLYALIAAFIITILNKTIKPVLIVLTLPITTITMGLFYPVINVMILYITSFLMGNNFTISGFFTAFFASIVISIFNIFMDGLIIKPITRGD